ncbi:hypothetical protein [Mesorhizobium sp. M1322]|uniref:hypothetical protein n=1 Tax=Mesorhizobium sp. M1322 TaxID=2957081 RepID=UPI003336DB1B
MGKIVRHELDPTNPVPLTEAQKAEIAWLIARPEVDIDVSDIPEKTEKFWRSARNRKTG